MHQLRLQLPIPLKLRRDALEQGNCEGCHVSRVAQCRGRQEESRFHAGVILYTMVIGQPVHHGDRTASVCHQRGRGEPEFCSCKQKEPQVSLLTSCSVSSLHPPSIWKAF